MRPQCLIKPYQQTPGHKGVHWPVQEAAEQPQKPEHVTDDEDGSDTDYQAGKKSGGERGLPVTVGPRSA